MPGVDNASKEILPPFVDPDEDSARALLCAAKTDFHLGFGHLEDENSETIHGCSRHPEYDDDEHDPRKNSPEFQAMNMVPRCVNNQGCYVVTGNLDLHQKTPEGLGLSHAYLFTRTQQTNPKYIDHNRKLIKQQGNVGFDPVTLAKLRPVKIEWGVMGDDASIQMARDEEEMQTLKGSSLPFL